jgi:ArsR family metal-binding transcriptional regulator
MDYTLHDPGAYPEPAIVHKIIAKLSQPQTAVEPGKSKMGLGLVLHKLLPQTNCQKCGKKTCLAFAIELAKGKCHPEECPCLNEPEFAENYRALAKLLE